MHIFKAALATAAALIATSSILISPAEASPFAPVFARTMMHFRYAYTVYPSTMPRADRAAPFGRGVQDDVATASSIARTFDISPAIWRPFDQFVDPYVTVGKKFAGMSASSSVCDGACGSAGTDVAVSKTWVVESVGISLAVYSRTGVLQAGWPKNYLSFFGLPNPGSCDPTGPGVTLSSVDFDPGTKRFFAFVSVIEGQFIGDTCLDSEQLYSAVSATSDPRGAWKIFVAQGPPGDVVILYPTSGLTPQAVCLAGDLRGQPPPHAFDGAIFACANKRNFETSGGPFNVFTTTAYDSLVPATVSAPDPGAAIFIASQNHLSGTCLSGPCDQYMIADVANPGSSSPALSSGIFTSQLSYNQTSPVDEPGCAMCVGIFDVRVEPHPVFNNGGLFFTHNTGLVHAGTAVSGALWEQINVTLDPTTHGLTGATFGQGGVVQFAGDRSAASSAIAVDPAGDAVLVFDSVGSALNPSMEAASRHAADPAGTLGAAKFIFKGTAPTTLGLMTEYGGATVDSAGNFWLAHGWSNGTWGTEIAKVKP